MQKHIQDVSQSGRLNEIKLLKIWRSLHNLDFPSVYLEYLLINQILLNRTSNSAYLADNFVYILQELSKDVGNPLFTRIVDPANTNNILSDLLNNTEKNQIITRARACLSLYWTSVLW